MSFYYYHNQPSAAERKEQNQAAREKLAKLRPDIRPVVIEGKKIVTTFWGKAWCDNIAAYEDYEYRLPRGRSYLRQGAVLDLQIVPGCVTALVAGSGRKPYEIRIDIAPLPAEKWVALKATCTGKIDSLLALAQGKLPDDVLAAFCDLRTGLFPAPHEIKADCNCPDWADLCKHLAAVMYGIGVRLDESPELFFVLRNIDQSELLDIDLVDALTADAPAAEIDDADLAATFGMEFDTLDVLDAPAPKKKAATKKAPVTVAPKKNAVAPTRKASAKKTVAKKGAKSK